MEKQVPNLQISFDLKSINPKEKTLKDELLGYNFLEENIQGFIRLQVFTKMLHPLRRVTTIEYNNLFLEHIENSNFQLNVLQDSQHFTFEKFLELQKILFIIKKLNGLMCSFNTQRINILSSVTHLQADYLFDLGNSMLDISPAIDKIPEKKIERIHFYLLSILFKIINMETLPPFIDSDTLSALELSNVRDFYPELLDICFKEYSSTMLKNYYFDKHFKLTYH
ncbi:hypothetical protein CL656_05485 [bacterium]|nr:hypothetical protein [bacterium]|tara:strand:- start:1026 stop:1697 length:672 start_codon:yes stop_codon:yes gene_type:complete